jgi:hypothetical protein
VSAAVSDIRAARRSASMKGMQLWPGHSRRLARPHGLRHAPQRLIDGPMDGETGPGALKESG